MGRGCDEITFHFSMEKEGIFSEKGGGKSVNEGFGEAFYNSVQKNRPLSEPPDSETENLLSSSPEGPKIEKF